MADKKSIVTVIDNIEEYKGTNKMGWGKYIVHLEGEDGAQKLDVPKDILEEGFELEEGMNVTLNKGPFSWILSDKSECITGEAPAQKQEAKPKRGKPQKETPSKGGGGGYSGGGGRALSEWDKYQIENRDPQMRMQTLIGISRDIYFKAIDENMDPEELLNNVVSGGITLDNLVREYLGLE